MKSNKPKKQRKERARAPLHKKYKLMTSNVSKALRKDLNKRSLVPRKGDEVKIVRGKNKGKTGKITKVDSRKEKIFIEGIITKKATGEETQIPIHPSNLMITTAEMEDKERRKIVDRKKV